MSKPIIRIHNTQTDEILDREMTAAEFAIYEAEQIELDAKQTSIAQKEAARVALLERLGITDQEATLLLS